MKQHQNLKHSSKLTENRVQGLALKVYQFYLLRERSRRRGRGRGRGKRERERGTCCHRRRPWGSSPEELNLLDFGIDFDSDRLVWLRADRRRPDTIYYVFSGLPISTFNYFNIAVLPPKQKELLTRFGLIIPHNSFLSLFEKTMIKTFKKFCNF